MKNVTADILNDKVFNVTLTAAQKLYFEVTKEIGEKLKTKNGTEDDIKNRLNLMIDLLKCWDTCISHMKTLEKISIIAVQSFPSSLFEVTIDALNHCKASSENYGDYFQAVCDTIAALFRHCVATLNSFYALLDTVISFDTNQEDEMNVLLRIIDATGKIATLSCGMDAKTLTEMWKQFGKLTTIYCLAMKELSPSAVTYHLKGLSESILVVLSSIGQKNQRSTNERSILCSRLLLKILEKLSSAYCGWIRNEVMMEIVIMLTNLFRYTEQCLKMTSYTADFIKFIVTNFTFMIDPFVDVMFKNDSFKVAFFEHAKNISKEYLGYHLLVLTVMKKLSSLPYETQQEWWNGENSVIDVCFRNIDRLTKDICIGELEIQMSRDASQASYSTNIYEATCLSIFSLVCQVSRSDFDALISLLLKYLLSGKYYSALLCSDIWCFVCSSGMCYSTFKYLWQIYDLLEHRESHMNVVILSNLLCRQFKFLDDNDKNDFMTGITIAIKPHQWRLIARMTDAQKKKQIQRQIDAAAVNSRISLDLKNLEEQPSLCNMTTLMKNLSVIQACEIQQDEKSIDTFVKMWNKIIHLLGDCEGAPLRALHSLAITVVRATFPAQGQTKYMTMILQSMASLYPYASSELHLEFCQFFNRCAVQLSENDADTVADLYIRLLSDSNTCVQQEAFESFEHLTRACPNGNLLASVAMTIKNAQSEVSRTLPAYISGEMVHEIVGFTDVNELLEMLSILDEKHVCRKRSSAEREEKVFKSDEGTTNGLEDVDKRAERVCLDMEQLIKMKVQIKRDVYDRLRQVCQRFLDLHS
ncbi:FIGNL1-interacting regulator of recombination and mitosis-like isoform X2 [Phymastichus coffea]|uniref:FIGNL1-interacting regulator of recombination and mitosis-like isoform X2 n=1 Tax=Phymastichus coffea TaxID=108790 RepID=UPI00273AA08E|nr:FIGNL1-interacting regulator of recombination and mitosis-like isoform X2 [Phymastichus coffea]